MRARERVPLPDVGEATDGNIIVNFTGFPGDVPRHIGLNTDLLQRSLIKWGGFNSIVLGAYEGDNAVDAVSGGVTLDSSGARLYASASSRTPSPQYLQLDVPPPIPGLINIRNGTLGIRWNINALNRNLAANQQYNAAIRTAQISPIIRTGAIAGVLIHSLFTPLESMTYSTQVAFAIFEAGALSPLVASVMMDPRLTAINLLIRAGVIYPQFRNLIASSWNMDRKDIVMDPLLFSIRPTRATIATLQLATQNIVRPIPSD